MSTDAEDFSTGVAMMSAAMTSPEARETLRLTFFIAALTNSACAVALTPPESIAKQALAVANAAVETWYGRST